MPELKKKQMLAELEETRSDCTCVTYNDLSVSFELILLVDISLFVVFQVFEFAAMALSSAFMLTLLSTSQTDKG